MRFIRPLLFLGFLGAWAGCGDDDGGGGVPPGADGGTSGGTSGSTSGDGGSKTDGGNSSSGGVIDAGTDSAPAVVALEVFASPLTALADNVEKVHISVVRRSPDGQGLSNASVSLSVSGTGNTVTPMSGVTAADGSFSADLTTTTAEAKTITATSDSLTAKATVTFTKPAGKLVFTTQPPPTVVAGVAMSQVVVTLTDGAGQPISNAGISPMAIALADNTTSAWLAGTTNMDVLSFGSFATLSVSEPGTGYHLVASVPGFVPVTSNAFDVTAGAWRHLDKGPPGIQGGNSLASDPNDGTLYMTTSDALWRSDDGATWTPLKRGLLSNNDYTGLWVDPGSSHLYAWGPAGFYISSDRGRSFINKRQGGGNLARSTRSLPGYLLVASGDGMYWSPDEGVTFTKSTGYPAQTTFAIAFDPKNPQIVYAGGNAGATGGQLYASYDAGKSWVAVGAKLALPIVGLEVDGTGKLFMAADFGGLSASTNGGKDFTPIGTQPTNQVNSIAVDPTDSKYIYSGTYAGFMRTDNGGTNWSLTPLANTTSFGTTMDQKARSTVYTFDSNTLLKSIDHGVTFDTAVKSGSFTSVRSVVMAGTAVYASGTQSGVWKSTDGGSTWAAVNTGLTSLLTGQLAVDPANASHLYVTSSKGIFVTTDAGAHWTKATNDLDSYSIGFIAIASGGVMYAASSSSFHKSVDSGATWNTIYPTYSPQITGLAASPADPNVVYLATTAALRKSTTGGGTGTWSSAISGGAFLNVIIDPTNANHVYASGTSTVYYSTNHWTDSVGSGNSLTSGVTGAALALDPANPSTVYVARDGVRAWKSTDGGVNYKPITSGLYDDVAGFAVGSSGTVYAGTARSGIFKTTTGGE